MLQRFANFVDCTEHFYPEASPCSCSQLVILVKRKLQVYSLAKLLTAIAPPTNLFTVSLIKMAFFWAGAKPGVVWSHLDLKSLASYSLLSSIASVWINKMRHKL